MDDPARELRERLSIIDLGRISYDAALELQRHHHDRVLESRERDEDLLGVVLVLEHDPPVITVSRRKEAPAHLLATEDRLRRLGVQVRPTDRGGDVTYHGPGQLVAYPIIDLRRLGLRIHPYVRALERAIIDTAGDFGVGAGTDAGATGVWIDEGSSRPRKLAAIGVRIRRWVSMHGLALNVTTDLSHFDLIVPCGIPDRSVTSLDRELGDRCPPMPRVIESLSGRHLPRSLARALARAGPALAEQAT